MQYNNSEINPHIIHCSFVSRDNCPPAGTYYEERRVRWYEIELILWGEGFIITEGRKIPTKKGDLFFRNPGMIVQGITPYSCYLMVFDMFYDENKRDLYLDLDFLNSHGIPRDNSLPVVSAHSIEYDLPHVMNVQQYSNFELLFHSMYNEYINNNLSNQFYLKTYLMQILMLTHKEWLSVKVLQNSKRSILSNYPKVMEVKKHIECNVSSRFDIQSLAEHAGLSPNFLCSIFKKILGYNIVEYINICKVNMAKKALLDTNKAVKEISIECGFDNESYFYTLFKKLEGLRPSEYREKNRLLFRGDTSAL